MELQSSKYVDIKMSYRYCTTNSMFRIPWIDWVNRGGHRVIYDYRDPRSQSLWNRARQEELVKFRTAAGGMYHRHPLKFIRRYLSVRINRGQKSIPRATVSYKQRESRFTSRKEGEFTSPFPSRRGVSRSKLIKEMRRGCLVPSLLPTPLIPEV